MTGSWLRGRNPVRKVADYGWESAVMETFRRVLKFSLSVFLSFVGNSVIRGSYAVCFYDVLPFDIVWISCIRM